MRELSRWRCAGWAGAFAVVTFSVLFGVAFVWKKSLCFGLWLFVAVIVSI